MTDKPFLRDEQVEAEFNGVWRPAKLSRMTDTGHIVVYYDEPFPFDGQQIHTGYLPPHRIRRPETS